jgi:hypothetical protein
MIESLWKKLNSWGNNHISLGGRLVLINSVLNSIPIYFMSLMKMPAQVIKKVTRIQREFLWGGVKGGRKLCWVKWKVVCQPKCKGGLGVRDIKAVNLSLLMKWRWRLLNSEVFGIWKDVLVAKYGAHILHKVVWQSRSNPRLASNWWKDICDFEVCVESKNWIVESISPCLGNGARTSFWNDKWCGDSILNIKFPRLFSLAIHKEASIKDLVVVEGDSIAWNLVWRRSLFLWEEERVNQLLGYIDDFRPSSFEDSLRWNLDPEGSFSVKSAFESLSKEIVPGPTLASFAEKIFCDIWDSPTPSKVIAFSWQLLYDRVPTKENLLLRGVIPQSNGDSCIWYGDVRETSSHLFLHCKVTMVVWYEIFKWLGVVIVIPPNLFYLYDCLSFSAKNKKARKGFRLIWHSMIWSIWRARNNHIFNNTVMVPLELVEAVKVLSWSWSVDRLKITPCLFFEWSWDPGICFQC